MVCARCIFISDARALAKYSFRGETDATLGEGAAASKRMNIQSIS